MITTVSGRVADQLAVPLLLAAAAAGACAPSPRDTAAPDASDSAAPREARDDARDADAHGPEADADTEPPSSAPDPAELEAQKRSIAATIGAELPALTPCYEAELAEDPSLGGKLEVTITIEAGGWVSAAQIDADEVGNDTVRACVIELMKSWEFSPAADGEAAEVSFTVNFAGV